MVVDFDWEKYVTPKFTGGFGNSQGWKRPWDLASLNILTDPPDTTPGVHQYIIGQDYSSGLRAPIEFMEITKTLDQGSWATIALLNVDSDRDIFEICDNPTSGYMLPRMKWAKYQTHRLNMKARDTAMPDPALFVGNLIDVAIDPISLVRIPNQQDGIFNIMLDFESPETFMLQNDELAPLYHHRLNGTTDLYHWEFSANDDISYDDIITRIVAWMNVGKPLTDFPITYSWTPKGVAPYTSKIFNPIAKTILDSTGGTAVVTFTNGSATVTGANTLFTSDFFAGQYIQLDADGIWVKILSIESNTSLTLTANYSGSAVAPGDASYNSNTQTIVSTKDLPTWEILRRILAHMGSEEGLGKKYIPSCSTTGVIDVRLGGFDKDHAVDEDFRSTWGAQDNTSFTIPGGSVTKFNMIYVPFTAVADTGYWFELILYESDGIGGWTAIYTAPFEYISYDPNNIHGGRYVIVPTQGSGTYKWDATLDTETGGSFDVAGVGGLVLSPPAYNVIHDPERPTTKVSFRKLKTFIGTQGRCSEMGIYHITSNSIGCPDGGVVNDKCPDRIGCYPDPLATHVLTGTISTNSTTTVTGSGTAFTTELEPNWQIKRDADGTYRTIKSIESDTSLTLTVAYPSTGGAGAATAKEGTNSIYGLLGLRASYSGTSNENLWDTICRQKSQDIYTCHLNQNTQVREPLEVNLVFNKGWTADLIGLYLQVYSPELDEMVTVRCTEQRHVFTGMKVKTFVRAFRV